MTCPVDLQNTRCPFEQANRQGVCTACGFDPSVHVPDQASRESYLRHCRQRLSNWTPPAPPQTDALRAMQEELARLTAEKARLVQELAQATEKPALQQTPGLETDEQLLASGQWRDPKTNMIWMRCSLGQTWDGKTCKGEAKQYTWEEARQALAELNAAGGFGGHMDWELPHIEDLHSLIHSPNWSSRVVKNPLPVAA